MARSPHPVGVVALVAVSLALAACQTASPLAGERSLTTASAPDASATDAPGTSHSPRATGTPDAVGAASAGSSATPVGSTTPVGSARPTGTATGVPSDAALPPAAELSAGRETRRGRLGSYTYGDTSGDSPWLPARALDPIDVAAGSSLTLRLDGAAIGRWRARLATAEDESGTGEVPVASGAPNGSAGTVTIPAPDPGGWVLAVSVTFAGEPGDAIYYWYVRSR